MNENEEQAPEEKPLVNPFLAAVTASNQERLQRLALKGLGVDINGLMLRHLISVLFEDQATQEQFSMSFQNVLASAIKYIEEQADAMLLKQGVASSLVVPSGVRT